MTEQCSNCRYYGASAEDDNPMGVCKRRAPTIEEETGDAVWPLTYDTEWCGEYDEAGQETISVPEAGARFYGLSRNGSYAAQRRGEIPAIRVGHKWRVPVAAMKRRVGAGA